MVLRNFAKKICATDWAILWKPYAPAVPYGVIAPAVPYGLIAPAVPYDANAPSADVSTSALNGKWCLDDLYCMF